MKSLNHTFFWGVGKEKVNKSHLVHFSFPSFLFSFLLPFLLLLDFIFYNIDFLYIFLCHIPTHFYYSHWIKNHFLQIVQITWIFSLVLRSAFSQGTEGGRSCVIQFQFTKTRLQLLHLERGKYVPKRYRTSLQVSLRL